MRILYVDCDALRPDHLGCYGYHRDTSPTIDRIAERGRRFTNVYASDAPCLPSRTALFTGRFGIHTGLINHGGRNADVRPLGGKREFRNHDGWKSWMTALRQAGHYTASISPFVERHAAWPVVDGFRELVNVVGDDSRIGPWQPPAHEMFPYADDWLAERAADEDWFLHVNFWDAHTPYTTPDDFGDPFADDPAPSWLTEERIAGHRESYGPHSAREPFSWSSTSGRFESGADLLRVPSEFEIDSREAFGRWIDGYDTGIRYLDHYLGKLLDRLEKEGVLDETLVIVSADHGENQGELNVYGDHQTADEHTCNVPLIVSGPGVEPGVDDGLHYQLDLAPTVTELVDGEPATRWDGASFAPSVTAGADAGRDHLVISQGAWACQRGVRWDDWLLLETYHDGYKGALDDVMLFDLAADPHETTNRREDEPAVVESGLARLHRWHAGRMTEAARDRRGGNPEAPGGVADPMWQVMAEGGPYHVRGHLEDYLTRLRATGREECADRLERDHGPVG